MLKIRKNKAVSEVFGTILLIMISVSLFSVVYIVFLSIDIDESSLPVNIIGTVSDNNIILEHRGGESLHLKTKIILNLPNGEKDIITLKNEDFLDNNSKNDGRWGFGEKVVYKFNNMTNFSRFTPVDITVVDVESNSVIMKGIVQEARSADVKISMSVSDNKPRVGDNIKITIKISNDKGPSDADGIFIKDIIPGSLKVLNFNPSQGSFDVNSNIWDVGNIAVGSSATLEITVKVVSLGSISEFTQFALILDGSGSIDEDAWELMKQGIVSSIRNEDIFPHGGSVELTVIQFGVGAGGYCARVELGPIIVRHNNYEDIANQIAGITQGEGYTPMASGIYLAADTLLSSINYGGFNPKNRQVVLLVTDGQPNVVSEQAELCGDAFDGYPAGRAATEDARNYLINALSMTEDQDEFDIIGVEGNQPINKNWLRDEIAWPQPGWDSWPPPSSGWVHVVFSWQEFKDSIDDLFNILFNRIDNTAEMIESAYLDPNLKDSRAIVSIYPKEK
jgi:uncharacterized repeat protein (TIGR01451 family)/flagellin-like protein